MKPDRISSGDAARLFLDAQGLCTDPERRATKRELQRTIHRLGFVQVDTINVVGRAHPEMHTLPVPDPGEHLESTCASAAERR